MSNDTSSLKEITFSDVAEIIKRQYRFILSKWLIILLVGIGGALLGIAYAWIQPIKYEANLTFSTDEDAQSSSALLGIASQFGFNLGGKSSAFSGENVLALIKSQKIITNSLLKTVPVNNKQERLLNIYLDANGMYKSFSKSPLLKNVSFPVKQDPATFNRLQDSVLLLVINKIQTEALMVTQPDEKLGIYKVTCLSESELFSKAFAEEVMAQVSDLYILTKTKRAQQTVTILQQRTDSIQRAYNAALYGRAALNDANLNPALQLPTVGIQRKQTDITVLATAYGELLKNLELAKFNLLRETPLIQIIDEPILPLKVVKYSKLFTGIIFAILFTFLLLVILNVKRLSKK